MIKDLVLDVLQAEKHRIIKLLDQGVNLKVNKALLSSCEDAIILRNKELLSVINDSPLPQEDVSSNNSTLFVTSPEVLLSKSTPLSEARAEWRKAIKHYREARDEAERLRLLKREKWLKYDKLNNKRSVKNETC